MKSYLWVEAERKYKDKLLYKCFKTRIFVYDTYLDQDKFYMKIDEDDFKKLKHFWFVKMKEGKRTGFSLFKEKVKKYHIFLEMVGLGICLLFLLSHVMVQVEVIHSNKEIRDLLEASLREKGIKKNSWRKSYEEITKIKEEILEEYPTKIEWLEIETKGMNYIVRVEERKMEEETKESDACHIIAMKDALVKEMIYEEGEALVKRNDAVKKGDILISGVITKDGEEKNVVCAKGKVYGEVWYQVSVSIPLNYEVKTKTGKRRWNIRLRNALYDDFLFRSRLTTYDEERHPSLQLLGNEFFFVIQHETVTEEKTYTEEEALEEAMRQIDAKIGSQFQEKEYILAKKVLKKEVINSTMNVEVFVSVQESIGKTQDFKKE